MTQTLLETWRDEDGRNMMKGNGDGVRAMFEASADIDVPKVARSLQLAQSLGMPETVVLEQPEWAEREQKARTVERNPLLAKWAEEDRQKAAFVRDEPENLLEVFDAVDAANELSQRMKEGQELLTKMRAGDEDARAEFCAVKDGRKTKSGTADLNRGRIRGRWNRFPCC